MKDKLSTIGTILLLLVFIGLILWASVIDPIVKKAGEIGTISSIVRYIVIAVVVISALIAEAKIMHDDRVQDPYKSILGFGILGLVALIGWYFRTHYGW